MSNESERRRLERSTARLSRERGPALPQQEVVRVGKRMRENDKERTEQEKRLRELRRQLQLSCWEIGEPALGEQPQLSLEDLSKTFQGSDDGLTHAEKKKVLDETVAKLSSKVTGVDGRGENNPTGRASAPPLSGEEAERIRQALQQNTKE